MVGQADWRTCSTCISLESFTALSMLSKLAESLFSPSEFGAGAMVEGEGREGGGGIHL